MIRKTNHKQRFKGGISALLTLAMLMSLLTPVGVFAAQSNEYVDPADRWLSSNNRTNELDVNATTTFETAWCPLCNKETTVLTYRVPEYTRSGETARTAVYGFPTEEILMVHKSEISTVVLRV